MQKEVINMSSKFSFVFLIMTGLLIMGVFACNDSDCLPENGDEVAIYNAKYMPAEFEKAKKIHVEHFGKAMNASGQDRITYFLEDKENNEVIAVSFFKKGNTVDEWHNTEARDEVLEKLKALLKEPITHKKLTVIDSHSTD